MKLLYLLRRPSALIPVAMSVAALAIVIGYAAIFGTARQADEGTAAHLWHRYRLSRFLPSSGSQPGPGRG